MEVEERSIRCRFRSFTLYPPTTNPARLDMLYRLIKQARLSIQAKELFKVLRRESFTQTRRVGRNQYMKIVLYIVISAIGQNFLLPGCSISTFFKLPITIDRFTLFGQPYVVLATRSVEAHALAWEPARAPGSQQCFILRLRVSSA